MQKLQRLGIGLGLTLAVVSGSGYAAEFTALKNIEATPMQDEELASVQGQGLEGYVGILLLYAHNLQQLYGGKQTPFLHVYSTPTKMSTQPSSLDTPSGGRVTQGSSSTSLPASLSIPSGRGVR